VYALIALGLTLIYGVLHIINFAHGAALMVALYAVYLLKAHSASTPTWRCRSSCPACSRSATRCSGRDQPRSRTAGREHPAGHAGHQSIVLENLALMAFKSDTRTIETPTR
jgi:branched-chain amino acid transport system permease protein